MPTVIVAPTARADLERLLQTHSLPPSTRERVLRSIRPLRDFPLLGASLHGRWAEFRFILGPWRWMIIVYRYDPDADTVAVLTARMAAAQSR